MDPRKNSGFMNSHCVCRKLSMAIQTQSNWVVSWRKRPFQLLSHWQQTLWIKMNDECWTNDRSMKWPFLQRLTNAHLNIPLVPQTFRSICQEGPISNLYHSDGISYLTWTILFFLQSKSHWIFDSSCKENDLFHISHSDTQLTSIFYIGWHFHFRWIFDDMFFAAECMHSKWHFEKQMIFQFTFF